MKAFIFKIFIGLETKKSVNNIEKKVIPFDTVVFQVLIFKQTKEVHIDTNK